MPNKKINSDRLKTSLVATAGVLLRSRRSPDELLGELFSDVQKQRIYDDGKTFVDLVPRRRVKAIQDEYSLLKNDPHFDLREFVGRHFYDLSTTVHKKDPFVLNKKQSIHKHISRLWEYLERRNRLDRGSLIALPHSYIVPGGRFNEQFYWDSYFIMLGLAAEGKWERVEGMTKNCAYMIRKYGYVPTANRTYFLSRSQPPVFVLMVRLLADHKGKKVLREYLPYLVTEYRFWMKGRKKLLDTKHLAYRRVVQMPNGTLLNRYYDNKATARPESLREDTETAATSRKRAHEKLFLHLRAAAESGWDFSSRWFDDPKDIRTIHTTDIIPIDLNTLLYMLEQTISEAYSSFRNPFMVRKFKKLANKRQQAIDEYLWSDTEQFYMDYNFHKKASTKVISLAAVFPLYAKIASNEQAERVARHLEKHFLKKGGLVTTVYETGQQWDSPNGWAPLQWMAIEGLRNYGYDQLAKMIADRWLALNERVFKKTHRLVEKYNVVDGDGLGRGGEYTLQDGFGWTNGVYMALRKKK
ncbi:MAG: alpha,alpha-trehalase TreF [Candidatus Microsaccharimonas sp.]